MSNRLSPIYESVYSSRVRRTTTTFALAILCVIISVAGPVLLRQHESRPRNLAANGKSVDSSRAGRAPLAQTSSQPRSDAERESAANQQPSGASEINKENSRAADAGHRDQSVSEDPTTSMGPAATTAPEVDSDTNKTGASEGATSRRPVPDADLESPAVFSIMKTDAIRNKLAAASQPRTGAEVAELRDHNQEDQGEEARERKERTGKRMLAASGTRTGGAVVTGSQEPQINGPSREELAAKGLDGVSSDIAGVKPSEYNGDVRDLPSVPVNFRSQEFEVEKPMNAAKVAAGATASSEPFINVPLAPMPSPLQNFAGLSFNSVITGGQAGAGWPPDVNGDVGLNHYILSVNDAFAIYNKTGTQLAAFTENSLWAAASPPTGTPCDANNFGDPVVVYDQFADRWILTNFAFATVSNNPVAPYYECFAISKTSDPVAGGWWYYAVKMDTGAAGQPPAATLADYPKFGNWNDGCLYMAANGFGSNGAAFTGVVFASFNKADMESGAVLRGALGFTATSSIFTMIPSNISGATAAASLPPASTPNYFVSESQSVFAYEVRKFTPGANCQGGALGAATIVTQPAYGLNLGNVVPQPPPATASHNLDTLDDRLMQKVQYRRVGSVESLWVTQDSRPSGASTARPVWGQINVSGGTVVTAPVQQQVYAPDTNLYRWMPSIAADSQGNVALGYSTSNATSPNFPSVAYSGRLVGDAANQLPQTEVQLVAGTGPQTDTGSPNFTAIHRWGDYTSMSVDPSDDCTFWYAGMYFTNVGASATRNWNTRIGSFKFPSCTSGCATITGTVSVGGTICNGSSSTVAVDVTGGTSPYTVKLTNNSEVQTGSAGQTHFVFTVSPTTTTIYQLDTASSHDNGSCPLTNSGSATVTVNQPPTPATAGSNQTICALGTTTGLGGNTPSSGTGTWTVFSGGAGTFSNIHTPNATFTHTSGAGPVVLKWTISNPPCTDSTAQVTITVNQPPTPATVGSNQTICALGTTTGLGGSTPASGTGAWTVFSGGAGTFSNINAPNATFTHTSGAGPVVLRWTISNPPCTDSTAQLTITVSQPPTPASVGSNQTICALGTTTGLGGNTPASGTGTWTVFSGGAGTFSNIHTANATFTHTSGAGPVVLKWTISNPPCTDSTAQVTITVNQPPTPATVGSNQTICALGTTTGLGGNTPSSGTGTWTVVSGGAGTFSNINTANAIFTHSSGAGPLVLRWTISNPPCTDSTAQVTITIKAQPTATVGGAQGICVSGTTAGLGGNTPPVGMTGMWSVVGGGTGTFSDASVPNATFTHTGGAGPITVRWTVSNAPCTSATADVTITINQPPATPTITPTPASVCAGSTGNIASGPVATGYSWSISNGTITSLTNIQAITYTAGGSGSVTLNLTVTNASGCGASNLLMVTIKPIALDLDHQSFPGNGGTGSVNVMPSDLSCAWTASTTATFIHITSGSAGTGNGAVQYSVDANPGPNIRSNTITIGGQTFTVYQSIDFLDVPSNDPFYTDIGKLAARGVTLGCGNGNYCPNDPVTREQMAAFILRSTGEFNPPTPGSQRFNDVPPANPFYNFIDRLAVLNITLGCTPDHLFYCPGDPVKREQMAAFILRGLGEFNPPTPGSQRFNDVPPSNVFYNFIDRMAVLNITLGCTPDHLMYCPNDSVTRAQMAAFLVRAFNL